MSKQKALKWISIIVFLVIFGAVLYQLGARPPYGLISLLTSTRQSASPSVTIVNNFNNRDIKLNKDHFAVQKIFSTVTTLQATTANQKITITKGLPQKTFGKFFAEGKPISASIYSVGNDGITIEIFLSETLEDKYFIYELSRNYFWSLLALDEYLKETNEYKANYDEEHEQTYQLTRESADSNDYPFVNIK